MRMGSILSDLRRTESIKTLSLSVDDPILGEEELRYDNIVGFNFSISTIKFILDRFERLHVGFVHNCRNLRRLFIDASRIDDTLLHLFLVNLNSENTHLECLGLRGVRRFPNVKIRSMVRLRVSFYRTSYAEDRNLDGFLHVNNQLEVITVVEDERRDGESSHVEDLCYV